MILTKHGKQRLKERLGLPKRAHRRHIEKVLVAGILVAREGWRKFQVIYQGFIYIFVLEKGLNPVLVTTYRIEKSKKK